MRLFCNEINKDYLNKEIKVCGWVKVIRKLGFLFFLEIQDISGSIQVVVSENFNKLNEVERLTKESTVTIFGKLVLRKSINKEIFNGDLEIEINDIIVHSISKTPPLLIQPNTDALEEVRFENRYLDLRRENIQKIFIFKSKLFQYIHEFFKNNNFNYIETPILAKPTPEGARDYLVPSRIFWQKFYALPQSPQIYKQLLMVSGFERYYQIAKCFRDEDLRSDRQPEFTQLDIEMSFIEEQDIYKLSENLISFLFEKLLNKKIETNFLKMKYDDAMQYYGCDKPDIRFKNLIQNSTDILKKSNSDFIKQILNNNDIECSTLFFDLNVPRNKLDELDSYLKNANLKNSFWIKVSKTELTGSLSKKIEHELIYEILKQHENTENGILFFNFDLIKKSSIQLGVIRNWIAKEFELVKKDDFKFLWIIDWPLFEYNDQEKRFVAAHHPFTQPQIQNHSNFFINKENAKARSYDLVLNGVELGGGSIRIIDKQMQQKMFEAIGLSEQEYKIKFETLLNAFEYGVPPHGGIAFGLDRLVQILLGLNNIKETIAFPKNTKAFDSTIKTPSSINEDTLKELGLKF